MNFKHQSKKSWYLEAVPGTPLAASELPGRPKKNSNHVLMTTFSFGVYIVNESMACFYRTYSITPKYGFMTKIRFQFWKEHGYSPSYTQSPKSNIFNTSWNLCVWAKITMKIIVCRPISGTHCKWRASENPVEMSGSHLCIPKNETVISKTEL